MMIRTGLAALAFALLHELDDVLVGGVPTPAGSARVTSYLPGGLDTISVECADRPGGYGWTPRHVESLRLSQSRDRAGRAREEGPRGDNTRALPSKEEYTLAADLAEAECLRLVLGDEAPSPDVSAVLAVPRKGTP